MLGLLFSSCWGFIFITVVVIVLLAVIRRFKRNMYVRQRKQHLAQCSTVRNAQPIHVFIHSTDPVQTTALVNLLFRQADVPSSVQIHVLEEARDQSEDLLLLLRKYGNTINQHSHQVHVHTVWQNKHPLRPLVAVKKILDCNPENWTGTIMALDRRTQYIVPSWDSSLTDIMQKNGRRGRQIFTSIPATESEAPVKSRAVLFGDNWEYPVEPSPLPQYAQYLYLDSKCILRTNDLKKQPASRWIPIRTAFIHPQLYFGDASVFRSMFDKRSTELELKELHDAVGRDLAVTVLALSHGASMRQIPFRLTAGTFNAARSRKPKMGDRFQAFLQNEMHIDVQNMIVDPRLQLGLWTKKSQPSERLTGILLRHGSEQMFEHKLQKIIAIQSIKKKNKIKNKSN